MLRQTSCLLGLSAILVVAGCATPELWSAAEGLGPPQMKLEVLRVDSAHRRDNGTVGVCLRVRDLESRAERDMTLHIPVENRDRLRVRAQAAQEADGSGAKPTAVYVEFRPEPADLTPDCVNTGSPIALLQSTIGPKICDPDPNQTRPSLLRLPPGATEAVYALNRNGHPANIGYLSTREILANSRAIDIPASHLRAVRPRGEPNPYLYLLTPVTVVLDTAVVAVVAVALAHNPPGIDLSCSSATR